MILRKPNVLVYVHRNGLIVAGKHVEYKRLLFPSDVVANLEVLDRSKYVQLCQNFFSQNNLHRTRVLVVLDNDLVFGKNIELDKQGKPETLAEAFIDAMPFEPGQRSCLVLQSEDLLQLLATNYDLYSGVAEALKASGASKIFAITPVAAYDLKGTERKVSALTEVFLKEARISRLVNFSSTEPL